MEFTNLTDSNLHVGRLIVKFSSDVNICSPGTHGATGNQATLDKLVRVVSHDFTILAGARFALVSVDDQVFGPSVGGFVHETPFHSGGETGASSATKTRCFDLVCNIQRVSVT
jgi:hypothetical protein